MMLNQAKSLCYMKNVLWFLRNTESQARMIHSFYFNPCALGVRSMCVWVKPCLSKRGWVWAGYQPFCASGPAHKMSYGYADTQLLSHNSETTETLRTNFSIGFCHLTWAYVKLLRLCSTSCESCGYFCISLQMLVCFLLDDIPDIPGSAI